MMDTAHSTPAGCWSQVSMTAELKQLVATLSREANAAATEVLVVAGSNALRGTGMLTRLNVDDSEVQRLTIARHQWHGLAALDSTCRLLEPPVHACTLVHVESHQLGSYLHLEVVLVRHICRHSFQTSPGAPILQMQLWQWWTWLPGASMLPCATLMRSQPRPTSARR